MANQLKMALIDTIHSLSQRSWSLRRIGRALEVHRETLGRNQAGTFRFYAPSSKPAA